MDSEIPIILDCISNAVRSAKEAKKTIYVFRDEGRWWECGKLPDNVTEYYLAYPNGKTDRSPNAPDVDFAEKKSEKTKFYPNIKPIFAWYDMWVGAFVDRKNRRLYLFPFPCLGLRIEWGPKP